MIFPDPRIVLLCPPDWFAVVDVKNAHMDPVGSPVDTALARSQWEHLRSLYRALVAEGLLDEVAEIAAAEGLEDMVFCANQSFPWVSDTGEKRVIMSKMRHPSRQKEVPHFEDWYRGRGYEILHLEKTGLFEGMGDLIPMPNSRLLFGGFGFRTEAGAYAEMEGLLGVEIVPVELVNPQFYHLDTCFLPISGDTAIACRSAFSAEGWRNLQDRIPNLQEADETEAAKGFALNAHIVPKRGELSACAILQEGNPKTASLLAQLGCRVIETDTSEYIKSGGSVFCMKMMLF